MKTAKDRQIWLYNWKNFVVTIYSLYTYLNVNIYQIINRLGSTKEPYIFVKTLVKKKMNTIILVRAQDT